MCVLQNRNTRSRGVDEQGVAEGMMDWDAGGGGGE